MRKCKSFVNLEVNNLEDVWYKMKKALSMDLLQNPEWGCQELNSYVPDLKLL